MTEARHPPPGLPPRDAAVDALRALALLSVIAVNWVGYAALPDAGPLGAARPADSWWGQFWLVAIAALLAGKGVTLLSFLFGYSQALSRRARGPQARAIRRRRMGRLLLLGLLHGLLIYMGDILTTYALCGLLLLNWSGLRLRQLRRRLIGLVILQLMLTLPLAWWLWNQAGGEAPAALRSLSTSTSWLAWTGLNAGSFAIGQLGTVLLGLPMPLSLMTAGLIAARLRLFSHRRWRPALRRCAQRCLWPGLLLNLAWGLALWDALRTQDASREQLCFALYLYPAMLMLIGLLPGLVLAAQRGGRIMAALAPAGRHTLSMYLGSSLLSWLLLSGAGLAWPLGTAALALLSLLYWGLWVSLAPRLQRRLPLEAWLSR